MTFSAWEYDLRPTIVAYSQWYPSDSAESSNIHGDTAILPGPGLEDCRLCDFAAVATLRTDYGPPSPHRNPIEDYDCRCWFSDDWVLQPISAITPDEHTTPFLPNLGSDVPPAVSCVCLTLVHRALAYTDAAYSWGWFFRPHLCHCIEISSAQSNSSQSWAINLY